MPPEQQVKEVVEAFVATVQRDLGAHVRLLTTDLLRVAKEAQDSLQAKLERAVGEARTEAEKSFGQKVDALRAEFAQEMKLRVAADQAELERAVNAARTEAEQAFGVKLEAQRSESTRAMELRVAADQAELERAVNAARAEAEQAFGAKLEAQRSESTRELEARVTADRAELERAVSAAQTEAEHAFAVKLDALRAELTKEMELRVAAERAALQAADADRQARLRADRMDRLDRLLSAMRRIDEATTLSGILEALAEGAAAEASRVAILLVEGDTLRTWGHFGFAADTGPVDMPVGPDGVLAAAVTLRQTSFVPAMLEAREPTAPAFMRVPAGHSGLVTPIALDGEVVALLYGDDADRPPAKDGTPIWTEQLELLVRHASSRLEYVTSERTVEEPSRQT